MSAQSPQRGLHRWLVPALLGLTVLTLDQLSKFWAATTLGPHPHEHSMVLVDHWLRLVYSRNTGVAFGLFKNMPQLFTVTSILITVGTIYAYARHLPNHKRWVQVAVGFIIGGALGNIVDRLRMGYVVDFISVGWWPVFNLADSAISVGVSMLALYLIFVGDEPPRVSPGPPRDDGLLGDLLSQEID